MEQHNFESLLVDVMEFGTHDIKPNAVYVEKNESAWPDGNKYSIYLGPCDNDGGLSDSISFSDDFMIELFKKSGIEKYQLHSSENQHVLYFETLEQSNDCFNNLCHLISSEGFSIFT